MRKFFTVAVIVLMVVALTAPAFAEDKTAPVAAPKANPAKISRGAKNIVLGWTEIPKGIAETSGKENIAIGLTLGTVKGFLNAFARTTSGLIDVVTFPIGNSEKPALKPTMTEEGETSPAAAGTARASSSVK